MVDTTSGWVGDSDLTCECPNCGVADSLLLGEIYL